jgi:hypothetical protein
MASDARSLSEYLRDYVDGVSRHHKFAFEVSSEKADQIVGEITRLPISGRESFSDFDPSLLRSALESLAPDDLRRDLLRLQFDDHYTRHLLELVPKMVARTLKLSELSGATRPPDRVAA